MVVGLCLSCQSTPNQHPPHHFSSHTSWPTNPPFPPQHPQLSPSFQQYSTSPCIENGPVAMVTPIQQHIIPLSEFKRGSISDDVTASRETLNPDHDSSRVASRGLCACSYARTYVLFLRHIVIWEWREVRQRGLVQLSAARSGRWRQTWGAWVTITHCVGGLDDRRTRNTSGMKHTDFQHEG